MLIPFSDQPAPNADQRRSYLELKLLTALATNSLLSCALRANTLKLRSGKSHRPPQLTA